MRVMCVCVALAFARSAVPAGSATAGEKNVAVRYGDLDLSKPAGQHAFKNRLEIAARRVCGPKPGMARQLREGPVYEACLKDTTERAMAAVPYKVATKLGEVAPVTVRLN